MKLDFIKLNTNFLLGAVISGVIINQNSQSLGISCLIGLLNVIPSAFFCYGRLLRFKTPLLLALYYLPWILVWTFLIILIIESGKPIFEQNNHRFELLILFISFFGTLMSSRTIHNSLTNTLSSTKKQ